VSLEAKVLLPRVDGKAKAEQSIAELTKRCDGFAAVAKKNAKA
jgi:hypothetical protein